jgi:hypothetical protein
VLGGAVRQLNILPIYKDIQYVLNFIMDSIIRVRKAFGLMLGAYWIHLAGTQGVFGKNKINVISDETKVEIKFNNVVWWSGANAEVSLDIRSNPGVCQHKNIIRIHDGATFRAVGTIFTWKPTDVYLNNEKIDYYSLEIINKRAKK